MDDGGKVVRKSKAEKRLDRKAVKAAKQEKRVAAALRMDAGKSVAQIARPDSGKNPVSSAPPPVAERFMRYAQDLHDKEGQWSWGVARDWGEEVWNALLQPSLDDFARKRWREIRAERAGKHPKHHEYEIHLICTEAYTRLEELELDDRDFIFRFRLDGEKRLYGFLTEEVFKTVWYDPTHQIFPVQKQKGGVRAKQQKQKAQKERKRRRNQRRATQ